MSRNTVLVVAASAFALGAMATQLLSQGFITQAMAAPVTVCRVVQLKDGDNRVPSGNVVAVVGIDFRNAGVVVCK